MSLTTAAFLESLKTAAAAAETTEAEFRREIGARVRALEAERAFAYRRLNFMRTLAETVAAAESKDVAVKNALAAVRDKLGWSTGSEGRTAVLARLAPLAEAMYLHLVPRKEDVRSADIGKLLRDFEDWYMQQHEEPFWTLFEHYIPETPRVDF